MVTTTVLLAEHDPAVAAMLARYLRRDGRAVRLAGTPELALAGLTDQRPEAAMAAVLDLTMPGLDPRQVRQALRTPAVFLVAPGPTPRGLNKPLPGASPARRWLTRPFGPRQLTAIVAELLSGTDGRPESRAATRAIPPSATAGDGQVRLDPARRVALITDREVELTGTEYAMLAALLTAQGRTRSRRQLLTAAGSAAADRSADVHIAQLRAKLAVPDLIRTVRGAGFQLMP